MPYAELHAHSAYTFLEGTDLPEDLVACAREVGLTALGIIDVDGMYSAVQTAQAAAEQGLPCVYGAELTLGEQVAREFGLSGEEGLPSGSRDTDLRLPVLATSQKGYHQLCAAISDHNLSEPGRRKACWTLEELAGRDVGHWKILTGTNHGILRRCLEAHGNQEALGLLDRLIDLFGQDQVVVESNLRHGDSPELASALGALADCRSLPLVATAASRCGSPRRQSLADVMTASRWNLSLKEARPHLPPFGTFLRGEEEMLQIHRYRPESVQAAADLAAECTFDLTLMEPELPRSEVPAGHTDASWLRCLAYEGAAVRYGERPGNPGPWELIDHELAIIEKLGFPGYFLIVKDIVDFCRSQDILCQGRGSAANSVVCYSLGITPVDAHFHKLMFERFLSDSRSSAPDIDIDIEAQRREEVIQYVYSRYGRKNAAQVANTITYRPRSSVRAAGKALGYGEEVLRQWSRELSRGWHTVKDGGRAELSIPPLAREISLSMQHLPQHMGIHPGGIVLTKTPVSEICPIAWAAKENRSVLQWDKEDCASAGLVKFDLLGLGMLTALRKSFAWLNQRGILGVDGRPLGLYNLPPEDTRVYDLLCAAESVGVFQVESRAQMSTLPRLKPREFYDLVIEVALIRPGPIQGQAVNPYLRRRAGEEPKDCHDLLKPALDRTLGVPLFQEQLMKIAVDVAGFTATEADELRRAIGSKRHERKMQTILPKLRAGMTERDLPDELQEQLIASLKGFAEFGFPESHAFSFAYLVYASAWLKVFHPETFYAALLASQPMGFYTPASLLTDAKKHGVDVRGPSVMSSLEGASVECDAVSEGDESAPDFPEGRLVRVDPNRAVRLGLASVKGLSKEAQERIVAARAQKEFTDLPDFASRTNLAEKEIEALAGAGAFAEMGITRRQAAWFAARVANPSGWQPFIPGTEMGEEMPPLPEMTAEEEIETDYRSMSLTTGSHPLRFRRESLTRRGVLRVSDLVKSESERVIEVAGLITHRQRPGTARGVTFLSLEDESGIVNVVCSAGLWKRYVRVAMTSHALVVKGRLQRKGEAVSIRAQRLETLELPVRVRSRDFR